MIERSHPTLSIGAQCCLLSISRSSFWAARPRVDPALVLAVGRIGGNLNQIARWLNHAMKVGRTDLDTLTVARRLEVIELQFAALLDEARRC